MRLIAAAFLLAAFTGPAAAATRAFTVTDFDRIRLSGPYDVIVRVGPAVSAQAEGAPDALDHARLDVEGGTLSIRYDRTSSGFSDTPAKVRIVLTVPRLRGAAVTGAGSLAIDKATAAAIVLSVAGTGSVQVSALTTDKLLLTLLGSGKAVVGGKAATARIVMQGEGRVDATKLIVVDADIALSGAGTIGVFAGRTAKVGATGAGDVTVLGKPACTVRNEGTGTVICGAHGK